MIEVAKIEPLNCPIDCENCCNCPYFGTIVDGMIVCYAENEASEEDEY